MKCSFRIKLILAIATFCLTLVCAAWFYIEGQELSGAYHDYVRQAAGLKELLQRVTKLDTQIAVQKKTFAEAQESGFYQTVSPRRMAAEINRLADECAIANIDIRMDQIKKTTELRFHTFTVSLQTKLDQDVFKFIHHLDSQGIGFVSLQEINIFRNFQPSDIPHAVSAQLKFDIVTVKVQ